jgi:hypothetical protein
MKPRAIIQLALNLAILAVILYLATTGISTATVVAAAILSLAAANAVFIAAVRIRTSRTQMR